MSTSLAFTPPRGLRTSPRSRTQPRTSRGMWLPKDFSTTYGAELAALYSEIVGLQASVSERLGVNLARDDFPIASLLRKAFIAKARLEDHDVPKANHLLRLASQRAGQSPQQCSPRRLTFDGEEEGEPALVVLTSNVTAAHARHIAAVERVLVDWTQETEATSSSQRGGLDRCYGTLGSSLEAVVSALVGEKQHVSFDDMPDVAMKFTWAQGRLRDADYAIQGKVVWHLEWRSPPRGGPVYQLPFASPGGSQVWLPMATAPPGFVASSAAWQWMPATQEPPSVRPALRRCTEVPRLQQFHRLQERALQASQPSEQLRQQDLLENFTLSIVRYRFGDTAAENAVHLLRSLCLLPADGEALHYSVRVNARNQANGFEAHWGPGVVPYSTVLPTPPVVDVSGTEHEFDFVDEVELGSLRLHRDVPLEVLFSLRLEFAEVSYNVFDRNCLTFAMKYVQQLAPGLATLVPSSYTGFTGALADCKWLEPLRRAGVVARRASA